MARAKEILSFVLEIVSDETELSADRIMSRCGETEVVDARWICVKILSKYGYYTSKIADLMKITPRYVQYILTDFEDRISLSEIMRINYERTLKRIRSLSEPHGRKTQHINISL